MTSLIEQFATQHRVRIRRDSCSFPIIPGKLTCVGVKPETGIRVESRSHIYEHDDKTLGVCLLFSSARMWNASKRAMLAAGFILRQDGYAEGTATFDPTDPSQSKLALFLARIRTRRVATPQQLSNLAAARKKALGLPTPPINGQIKSEFSTRAVTA